jgi:hypothetical protein
MDWFAVNVVRHALEIAIELTALTFWFSAVLVEP